MQPWVGGGGAHAVVARITFDLGLKVVPRTGRGARKDGQEIQHHNCSSKQTKGRHPWACSSDSEVAVPAMDWGFVQHPEDTKLQSFLVIGV